MANSVVPYGKLKPEVKLAQAISEFALVLDEPRRRTFKALRTRSPPLPSDVIRLTEEINSDGSRQHKSWKPFGTRLVAILERVQLISCVGDAIVYGAQNMIASGIWAAVKMSLQLATSYLTYFDKVTEILMRVGRMSHIKQDLVMLFSSCSQLQNAMCEYLIVVTNFCRGIVLFTKKARFAQFISSVSREFLDFEDQLATWSSFIQERCNYLATKSQLESSKVVSNTSRVLTSFTGAQKKEQERQTQKRVFALQRHLSPYQSDFEPAWRRERRKGTATWIFTHRVYLLWCAKDTSDVLFISGSLGSGKTVLMANIFASIVSSSTVSLRPISSPLATASFFCQSGSPKSLESRHIIGSILYQLVRSETVNISPKFLSDSVPNTLWGENIDDLLNLALPLLPLSSYYIILDGLDDCSVQVVEEVAMILSKLMEKRTTRLCLSSRLGSKITGILEDSWPHALNISLSAVDRYDEIRTFVETEIDRRCSRYQYPISHVLLDGIKRTLSEKTEGMFLWLILQINALFPRFQNQRVVSDFDIIQLLETLPPDLPHAFDRAIEGITDMRYGSRLFEIIASAQRRLTLDELQVALNVKPGIVEWNPSTLPYHALSVIYSCGGGLLDVDEEDSTVAFIHSSVLTYLTNPRLNDPCPLDTFCFSLEDARMNMGYICITYLNYSLWERQLALINQPVVVANRLTGTVASAINRESSHMVLMSTFRAARDLFHPSRPAVDLPSFDLIRLLQQFSATPGARDIVRSFFGYARDFWLIHTSQFSLEDNFRFSLLLKRLLRNRSQSLNLPWNSLEPGENGALSWAIRHSHTELFRCALAESGWILWELKTAAPDDIANFNNSIQLCRRGLGDIIAHCVWSHCKPRHSPEQQDYLPGPNCASAVSMVQWLINHGADPNASLMSTIWKPYPQPQNQPGIQPAGEDSTPARILKQRSYPLALALTLSHPCTRLAQELIGNGASVNENGQDDCPLLVAAEAGNVEIIELLLSKGADPNTLVNGTVPLFRHLYNAGVEARVLHCLLKAGASVGLERPMENPLLLATLQDGQHEAVMGALRALDLGFSLCTTPKWILTRAFVILLDSPESHKPETRTARGIESLIIAGADVNDSQIPVKNITEWTEESDPRTKSRQLDPTTLHRCRRPLIFAFQSTPEASEPWLAKKLLFHGADPDVKDEIGRKVDEFCQPGGRKSNLLRQYRKDVSDRMQDTISAVGCLDLGTFLAIIQTGAIHYQEQIVPKTTPASAQRWASQLLKFCCNPHVIASREKQTATKLFMAYSLMAEGYPYSLAQPQLENMVSRATEQDLINAFDMGLMVPAGIVPWPKSWSPRQISIDRGMHQLQNRLVRFGEVDCFSNPSTPEVQFGSQQRHRFSNTKKTDEVLWVLLK